VRALCHAVEQRKTLEDTENLWLHFNAKLNLPVYYIATQQFRSGGEAMITCVAWTGIYPLAILRLDSHPTTDGNTLFEYGPKVSAAQGRGCPIISTLCMGAAR